MSAKLWLNQRHSKVNQNGIATRSGQKWAAFDWAERLLQPQDSACLAYAEIHAEEKASKDTVDKMVVAKAQVT